MVFCRNTTTIYLMKPIIATLKTLKVRIRDKHAPVLKQWAFECNQVWNEANAITAEYSDIAVPEVGYLRNNFTAFDLAKSQAAFKKLGWIPFKSGAAVWKDGQVRYNKHYFKVWDSYGLSQYAFRSGSFTEDSRGNSEKDLATAQRANKKQRVKAIHAKVKNRRADSIHKFTTQLVRGHSLIVVGNVSSKALIKTKMAKSVLDAGWFMLKTQLDAKSKAMQGVFLEVNEAYSTQACSCCGSISINSPKGRAGLGIREWTCPDCGALHDRDVNAARNILAAGHCRLAGGIPVL